MWASSCFYSNFPVSLHDPVTIGTGGAGWQEQERGVVGGEVKIGGGRGIRGI